MAQDATSLPPPSLTPPEAGPATLRVLAPSLLELSRVILKPPDPARIASWDFATAAGALQLPAPATFNVLLDGQPVMVQRVGFKRRALYAPPRVRDLRVGHWLYLELASPCASGQTLEVRTTDSRMGGPSTFTAVVDGNRLSPVIHVNQEGYLPGLPKIARVGAFLGTLGEIELPQPTPFEVIEDDSGRTVFSGELVPRLDVGFETEPKPYQHVLVADFSSFSQPGRYRVRVAGLGMSHCFRINEDIAALFARTYALGLYHQRCGTANDLPHTRFAHGACHLDPASVPGSDNTFVAQALAEMTASWTNNPRHVAPRLDCVDASRYPFVKTNSVDVSLGHHDAGDYSKYTINSAGLIHHLVFAADAFPGVAGLDNLGLPESGDGCSDLLQEAKWEADFLVKMQDADGGFYFLVYPEGRKYESDVTPDHGDAQVVFPKNTAATAAATAALAQIASSPRFRTFHPEAAARYLGAARRGWNFLQTAIARFGRDGAYQQISHYGDVFMHDDELAWAAAELFAATGEAGFEADLKRNMDPADRSIHRWTWWQGFEGYGAALRSYAFAARTGRLPAGALDPLYLAKCEAELIGAGQDIRRWSDQCAYGTSFPDHSKRMFTAGWFFSIARAFDLAVAHALQPGQEWLDTIVSQIDYEAGVNPVNVCFITGLGARRPTILVSQYALNAGQCLPPTGYPIGQIQAGMPWLDPYRTELGLLNVPSDGASTNAYPLYDRWCDTWNVGTEAVIVDQARGMATLAFLMARTPLSNQAWQARPAQVTLVPGESPGAWQCSLEASGLDLRLATLVWESPGPTVAAGTNFAWTVARTGHQRVEAEAQLPDGRRVFAERQFLAARASDPTLATVTITAPDPQSVRAAADPARFEITRSGDLNQAITVAYDITGAARNGTDYAWINGSQYHVDSGTAILPAGVSQVSLFVNPYPLPRSTLTNPADVVLTLAIGNTCNIGLPHQARAVIRLESADNRPPVARAQIAFLPTSSTSVPITLTGSDPDLDRLEFAVVSPPSAGTLTGQPPRLVYIPGPGFIDGTDQFTFIVSDSDWSSLPATVTCLAPRIRLQQVGLDPVADVPGLAFRFAVNGVPDRILEIQTSTDLQTWSVWQTSGSSNEVVVLSDAVDTTQPQRWFRALLHP
jgi:hypothetical protein